MIAAVFFCLPDYAIRQESRGIDTEPREYEENQGGMSMKPRIVRGTLLIAIGSLLSSFGPLQETVSPTKVYSVCEVLQNLERLNHKAVAVRGVVVSGGHGSFLSGTCKSHIITKGFEWPDTIWLVNPRDSKGLFEADKKADEKVRNEIKRLSLGPKDRLVLTYVGSLETKDLAERVETRAGHSVPFGFGPDNDAPAQLTVKTVMDPNVLRFKE